MVIVELLRVGCRCGGGSNSDGDSSGGEGAHTDFRDGRNTVGDDGRVVETMVATDGGGDCWWWLPLVGGAAGEGWGPATCWEWAR